MVHRLEKRRLTHRIVSRQYHSSKRRRAPAQRLLKGGEGV